MTTVHGWLASWRATLRIARRTAWRSRGRSALVLAMIALPVYAGTVIAVTTRTTAVPWQSQATWQLGAADVVIDRPLPDSGRAAPGNPAHRTSGSPTGAPGRTGNAGAGADLALPAGSRMVPVWRWYFLPVHDRAGDRQVESWAADLTDPLVAGRFRLRSGRAPHGADEVALSARLARDLHVRTGDTVRLGKPEQHRRVVAVLDRPNDLSATFVVTAADHPVPGRGHARSLGLAVDLPGHPGRAAVARAMAGCGCDSYTPRDSFRPTPGPRHLSDLGPPLLIAGFAVAEVVLLAGAAFAVGARRQTRELGLLAAAGGNARQVAQVVLGGGLVLGAVAGLLGAAAGVLTVAAGRSVVQRLANHVVDHTVVRPAEVAGIAALAVLAGLAAAVLPARGAARRPVLAALTGRRAEAGGSRRMVVTGLGTAGVGVLVTALGAAPPSRIEFVTAGSVLGLAGVVLCAPALVGLLARWARWLPLPARLAVRDGGRHRNRTGAAVAAVAAAVAGSMALNLYLASQDDANRRRPTQVRLGQAWVGGDPAEVGQLHESDLATVTAALPVRDAVAVRDSVLVHDAASAPSTGAEPMPVMVASADGSWRGVVGVGGVRLVRAVTHRTVPAGVTRALRHGQAVVVQPGVPLRHGKVTVQVPGSTARPELPAVTFRTGRRYYGLPAVVIGEQAARRLGLHPVATSFLIDTTRMPTRAEERAANAAFDDLTDRLDLGGFAVISVQRGYSSDLAVALLVLAGVSGLVTLMATGVAVGLAVAESRDDLSTLAAVGAAPRVRRVLSAAQAGVIAGLGTVLGMVGGILPAAGVIRMDGDLRWVVPWRYLALFAAVPVLVTLLTGAVTRSRLTLVRRL